MKSSELWHVCSCLFYQLNWLFLRFWSKIVSKVIRWKYRSNKNKYSHETLQSVRANKPTSEQILTIYVCVMNPKGKHLLPLWSLKSISQIYRLLEHNCFILTHLLKKKKKQWRFKAHFVQLNRSLIKHEEMFVQHTFFRKKATNSYENNHTGCTIFH